MNDLFNLLSRHYFDEIKKCVVLCHNCHGELHEGLIEEERVLEINKKNEQVLGVLDRQVWSDLF